MEQKTGILYLKVDQTVFTLLYLLDNLGLRLSRPSTCTT